MDIDQLNSDRILFLLYLEVNKVNSFEFSFSIRDTMPEAGRKNLLFVAKK